jgi:hypothetical protein
MRLKELPLCIGVWMIEEVSMAGAHEPDQLNDIPTLALKAAMEVAEISPGKKHGYANRLRDVLLQQTADPPTAGSVRNLAPNTIEAYRRAAEAATKSAPSDFGELSAVLKQIAMDLEVFAQSDEVRTGRLLRFLTTVHDELLGRRQDSDLRRRPANPRRI